MKSKDLSTIAIIVVVSAVLSFVISSKIFTSPKQTHQKVEVVNPISTDFPTPDNKYFNAQSIDPTVKITIGTSNSSNPFGGN